MPFAPHRRLRRASWMALCLCLWLSLSLPFGAARAESAPLERQVKAAYLYKFAGFVEWPEGSFARPDAPLQIGVAGNDALAEQIEQMVAGRSINGHPIAVRKLHRGEALAGLHILFVGALERSAAAELLAAARGQSLLTVTDSDDMAALGSMVNFVVADDRLRFQVALKAVAASRLRISARMLAAAYKVQGAI
ncbi:MAG TPA: YfiR family protein [Telluria sp.]|nr:YfiR family protein [Telluria sp.]